MSSTSDNFVRVVATPSATNFDIECKSSGSNYWGSRLVADNSGNFIVNKNTTASTLGAQTFDEAFRVTPSLDLGLGDSSLGAVANVKQLSINGTSGSRMIMKGNNVTQGLINSTGTASSSTITFDVKGTSNGTIAFAQNGSNGVYIYGQGGAPSLGIGVATPSELLHVNGKSRLESSYGSQNSATLTSTNNGYWYRLGNITNAVAGQTLTLTLSGSDGTNNNQTLIFLSVSGSAVGGYYYCTSNSTNTSATSVAVTTNSLSPTVWIKVGSYVSSTVRSFDMSASGTMNWASAFLTTSSATQPASSTLLTSIVSFEVAGARRLTIQSSGSVSIGNPTTMTSLADRLQFGLQSNRQIILGLTADNDHQCESIGSTGAGNMLYQISTNGTFVWRQGTSSSASNTYATLSSTGLVLATGDNMQTGYLTFDASSGTSTTGTGVLYYNNTNKQLMYSCDGGAAVPILSGGTSSTGYLQNGNSYGATAVLGTNDNFNMQFETNNIVRTTLDTSGRFGIGITSPTSLLHLAGGTTTIAPLRLTSGTNLTTPVDGTMEFDGSLRFTQSATRYSVPMAPTTNGQYAIPIFANTNSNILTTSSTLSYNTSTGLLNLGSSIPQQPASGSGYYYLVADTNGNVKREASLQYITVLNTTITNTTAGSTAIPGSPSTGDAYIIPSGANVGVWSAFSVGNIATWNGTTWVQTVVTLNNAAYLTNGLTYVVTSTGPVVWSVYGTSQIDGASVLPEAWSLGGNTNTSQFGLGNINAAPLSLITNNTTRMTIAGSNAYVGIGVTTPLYPLHVTNSANQTTTSDSYFINSTLGLGVNPTNTVIPTTIFANGNIVGSEMNVLSDRRIKNIINPSSGQDDLDMLDQVEIVNYTYKDETKYGSRVHKKVIAQQIEEVYPNAVKKSQDSIPDIFRKVSSWSHLNEVHLELGLESHGLSKGEKVRILFKDSEDKVLEVISVSDDKFVVEYPEHKTFSDVFVYGRFVEDLLNVDYDALSMLNLSATKELKKKVVLNARSETKQVSSEKILGLNVSADGFANADEVFPEFCRNGTIDAVRLIPYLVGMIQRLSVPQH